jgi:dATP pyrophosphohydrolase
MTAPKQPVSALVVIHTPELEVLLLERAAHPGFWQSVTGSREGEESLIDTAQREVDEETGILAPLTQFMDWSLTNTYEIFSEWRHRYAPGVTANVEHVFSLCVPDTVTIATSPEEHRNWQWLPWQEAAARCFSWSNRDAILMLPERYQPPS